MPSGSRETRAKINLSLHITGRRRDGYHELESIVAFVNVGDRIAVLDSGALTLSVTGPFASTLVQGEDNLVLRAARLMQQKASINSGAHLTLEKHLPVASGMGGGSGDAAATLLLLRDFWKIDVSDHALHEIALTLGADVPMCLYGRPAIVRGMGEQIEPMDLPQWHVLLANPLVALPTADIFREYTASTAPFDTPQGAQNGEIIAILKASHNALEPAAIRQIPVIGELVKAIAATDGCLLARMSGSGATCFGLYEAEEDAWEAKTWLELLYPHFWLKTGVLAA